MGAMPWVIHEFEEIDSTNTWLVQQARSGAPAGTVARADFQTAGRGRLDRTWEAPRGVSLLTSVLVAPRVPLDSLHLVTVSVAMAARSGLIRLCGLAPELKWPNDLLVRDRKLGGILAELVDESPRVVVGIGLNLQWPGPADVGGTCVRDEAGITIAPRAMLDIFLAELELLLPLLDSDDGRAELTSLYNDTLATLGRVVRVERMAGAPLVGRATRVLADGSLCVDVDGAQVAVRTGDVVHLREEQS